MHYIANPRDQADCQKTSVLESTTFSNVSSSPGGSPGGARSRAEFISTSRTRPETHTGPPETRRERHSMSPTRPDAGHQSESESELSLERTAPKCAQPRDCNVIRTVVGRGYRGTRCGRVCSDSRGDVFSFCGKLSSRSSGVPRLKNTAK